MVLNMQTCFNSWWQLVYDLQHWLLKAIVLVQYSCLFMPTFCCKQNHLCIRWLLTKSFLKVQTQRMRRHISTLQISTLVFFIQFGVEIRRERCFYGNSEVVFVWFSSLINRHLMPTKQTGNSLNRKTMRMWWVRTLHSMFIWGNKPSLYIFFKSELVLPRELCFLRLTVGLF